MEKKKKKVMFSIEKEVIEKFDDFCKEKALIKSKVIENLIKKFLDEQKKIEGKLF